MHTSNNMKRSHLGGGGFGGGGGYGGGGSGGLGGGGLGGGTGGGLQQHATKLDVKESDNLTYDI